MAHLTFSEGFPHSFDRSQAWLPGLSLRDSISFRDGSRDQDFFNVAGSRPDASVIAADIPNEYDLLVDTLKCIYWADEDMWLGYLEEFPDYMTQGESLEELQENLRDLYADLK